MKRQSAVESSEKYKGFDETGTYCQSYQSVYDLMTHSEDMETEDLLQYTLTALLLLEILRHSGWFGSGGNADYEMKDLADLKDERMTDDERLIGSLLLRHILQLVCNAHAITELKCSQTTNSVVEEQNQVRIATAIYPTASLMNHSCDPSIIASFNKDTLVVRAVKDITKGEEVFNCYGPHHKRMSLDERQQSLQQQYFFTCQCKPCTAGERTSQFLYSYRCKQCEGPSVTNTSNTICCQTCGFIDSQDLVSVKKADSLFQDGVKLLQENRNSDALDVLLECCKLRQECFYRHNKILSETQDCIARCYASLGNFEDSAKFLRQSIEAVKVIYGPESIETGNELQKLTEILISAHRWQEALDCVHDAIKIFTEHYSESHETVRELFDMKEQLVQVLEFSR